MVIVGVVQSGGGETRGGVLQLARRRPETGPSDATKAVCGSEALGFAGRKGELAGGGVMSSAHDTPRRASIAAPPWASPAPAIARAPVHAGSLWQSAGCSLPPGSAKGGARTSPDIDHAIALYADLATVRATSDGLDDSPARRSADTPPDRVHRRCRRCHDPGAGARCPKCVRLDVATSQRARCGAYAAANLRLALNQAWAGCVFAHLGARRLVGRVCRRGTA